MVQVGPGRQVLPGPAVDPTLCRVTARRPAVCHHRGERSVIIRDPVSRSEPHGAAEHGE